MRPDGHPDPATSSTHPPAQPDTSADPATAATRDVNVLLIGGGGREHALAWKLAQSPRLATLWATDVANPGIAALARHADVPVDHKDPFRLQRFCQVNHIGLVVIGPEEPLANGLADLLQAPGRTVFGPTRDAARLESDKAWAKQLLRAAAIPTADGRTFTDPAAARAYLESRDTPHVVKASGLARGKGVFVPASLPEALEAVDRIMVKREFGDAGREIVVEERLKGREVSVFAFVDGRSIYLLEPCQDHKRIGDGATGPNTGGMGALCPTAAISDAALDRVQREILVPTVDALRRDGITYRGLLYAGLMLTPAGPKILEYNVRFGDPETQALLPLLATDLLEIMLATGEGRLDQLEIRWHPGACVAVVLASRGYPGAFHTGLPVGGLDEPFDNGVNVFQAGTRRDDRGRTVTAGGRVLAVSARGTDRDDARRRAYAAAERITFDGRTMRTDIGLDVPG